MSQHDAQGRLARSKRRSSIFWWVATLAIVAGIVGVFYFGGLLYGTPKCGSRTMTGQACPELDAAHLVGQFVISFLLIPLGLIVQSRARKSYEEAERQGERPPGE